MTEDAPTERSPMKSIAEVNENDEDKSPRKFTLHHYKLSQL